MTLQQRIYESQIQNLPEALNSSSSGSIVGGSSKAYSDGMASLSADSTNPITTGMKPGGKGGKDNRLTPDSVQYWNAQKGEFEKRDDLVSHDVKTKADSISSHAGAISHIFGKDDPVNSGPLLGGIFQNSANEIRKLRDLVGVDKAHKLLSLDKDSLFTGNNMIKVLKNSPNYRKSIDDSGVGISLGKDGKPSITDKAQWNTFTDRMDLLSKDRRGRGSPGGGDPRSGGDDEDDPASAGIWSPIRKGLPELIPGMVEDPTLPDDTDLGDWLLELWNIYEIKKEMEPPKDPPTPPPPGITPTQNLWTYFPPPGHHLTSDSGYVVPQIPPLIVWAIIFIIVLVVITNPGLIPAVVLAHTAKRDAAAPPPGTG